MGVPGGDHARADRSRQPASCGGDAAGRLLRPPAGGPTLRVARPGRHGDHPRDAPGRDRGGRGRAGAARRPHASSAPWPPSWSPLSRPSRPRCRRCSSSSSSSPSTARTGRCRSPPTVRWAGSRGRSRREPSSSTCRSTTQTEERCASSSSASSWWAPRASRPGAEPSREELQGSAEVVDRWAAARLLTLDVHPQTRVPTVEVAHEALVREWPRLRQWIEDDRSELIVLGRIRESAATWADARPGPVGAAAWHRARGGAGGRSTANRLGAAGGRVRGREPARARCRAGRAGRR